jgi:alkyl sulfatase BDS1-like metallo-beta-lactamase superfamily hydrolase
MRITRKQVELTQARIGRKEGNETMHRIHKLLVVLNLSVGVVVSSAQAQQQHFHAKGKPPSRYTMELQESRRATLPFDDQRDLEEARRGFIAAPPYKQIKAEAGHVAWDMASYEFLLKGENYPSIHPSLQRQAVLNMAYGLYEVVPGKIYQVRGFDLANFTLVKGDTGWIVFDPLTAKETAKAALDFANEKLGKRPVSAVVYSHSHGDHFGGVRGVVEEADVRSGKVKVIAPVGFMDHAVSENVMAGTAMTRRMFYQYGVLLPRSPFGHVDQSIGKNTAAGNTGVIEPTVIIEQPFEELTIDGVEMVFQNTPGTEAPAEMNTWLPQMKAFWAAENITGTIHNIYTLRGALVRDALEWSKQINQAIYRFGMEAEVMFASHSWPRWGNERILEVMRAQRDAYAHLNNHVLHLANSGVTINEIHNVYKQPKSLQQQWAARSYHGSEAHNSRAVVNRYLGYWDANPATLIPLSPGDSAPLYVEMMGGAEKILAKGRELHDQGKYLLAQEVLNKLVYAQPDNQVAKDLLADVWEQIGYQQESPSVRNSFLAGAYELRSGIPTGAAPKGTGPDMIRGMTTGLWLDFLGVRLQSEKVEGQGFVVNFVTPDNGEKYVVELSNGTLTNIQGQQAMDPALTITVNRADLETVMMGKASFDDLVAGGKAKLDGDRRPYDLLKTSVVHFDMGFQILPGTKAVPDPRTMGSFEQTLPAPSDGG